MENCFGNRRCLICRRATLKTSSIDSEKLVSNASSLQDFLNCFHINVLDSDVRDLSTSCQVCLTCEQFIAEWSSIQTQMTQLTRRAAQLEATLTALLLSAHGIPEKNHDDNAADIIKYRIQNSQEVELQLRLQQTVDDIRNELRKKYSVRVMLDKIEMYPVKKLEPLPIDYDIIDEAWDHWVCAENIQSPVVPKIEPMSGSNDDDNQSWDHSEFGTDDSEEEYLPSEDELDDEERSEQILRMRMETEEEGNRDYAKLQESLDSQGMKVQAGNMAKGCPRKSKAQPAVIPDGPNKFKYNGYDIRLNDQDRCYYCGVCNFYCGSSLNTVLGHIREMHYTAEDKIKFSTAKISNNEWLHGGKYKIIQVDAKKFKCVSCGSVKTSLHYLVTHIRTQHVNSGALAMK